MKIEEIVSQKDKVVLDFTFFQLKFLKTPLVMISQFVRKIALELIEGDPIGRSGAYLVSSFGFFFFTIQKTKKKKKFLEMIV